MITCTKRLEFDYGHRVLNHGGKCKNIHGHRGVAEITVQAPELNDLGMVVDFGVIKEQIGAWIDRNFDHNLLLHKDDPLLEYCIDVHSLEALFSNKYPYVMLHGNPTAENMAKEIHYWTNHLLPSNMKMIKVRVWETPTCYAEFTPDETIFPKETI